MTTTLPQIGSLNPADLSHDLGILESSPAILDAFLPASLRSSTFTAPSTGTAPLNSYTRNSSPSVQDSVALSRAFVDIARTGVLQLVADGAEGKLGVLGEDIERVRVEAEQLEGSLEGI